VLEDLGNPEGVQERLVVPDLGVEVVALKPERGLGELEILVRADFDGCPQRQQALEQEERG
jgi:hypothetical protein